jgi:hypothetical protein
MAAFSFLIEDDRYSVPSLEFVIVRDARRAEEIARSRLGSSSHYLSATVHLGDMLLFRLDRPARDGGNYVRRFTDSGLAKAHTAPSSADRA